MRIHTQTLKLRNEKCDVLFVMCCLDKSGKQCNSARICKSLLGGSAPNPGNQSMALW